MRNYCRICSIYASISRRFFINYYSIFTAKKGRPKCKTACNIKIVSNFASSTIDPVLSLFRMKKLNEEQFASARFYHNLYSQYLKNINAPIMHTTSLITIHNDKMYDSKPAYVSNELNEIKSILAAVNAKCEDIFYKVIIEKRIDCIDTDGINQSNLHIFKNGLNKVSKYRNKCAVI